MKRFLLFFFCLVAILYAWRIDRQIATWADSTQRESASSDWDALILAVDARTYNKMGGNSYRVQADTLRHLPHAQHAVLENPVIHVYATEQPTVNVSAQRGWIKDDKSTLRLQGTVTLQQDHPPASLQPSLTAITEKITIYPSTQQAETDSHVTLFFGSRVVTTAKGARVNLHKNHMKLMHHIKTIIYPTDKKHDS